MDTSVISSMFRTMHGYRARTWAGIHLLLICGPLMRREVAGVIFSARIVGTYYVQGALGET